MKGNFACSFCKAYVYQSRGMRFYFSVVDWRNRYIQVCNFKDLRIRNPKCKPRRVINDISLKSLDISLNNRRKSYVTGILMKGKYHHVVCWPSRLDINPRKKYLIHGKSFIFWGHLFINNYPHGWTVWFVLMSDQFCVPLLQKSWSQ